MTNRSGFLKRWLGRPAEESEDVSAAAPVGNHLISSRGTPLPPSPFGQFGEKGERVGEHISYFLSRLEDVYTLRQEFASVAEPLQDFTRSHDEAQTRLAETMALLSRERAESHALRAENLALREAEAKLDDALVGTSNQLKIHSDLAETRGSQLRSLQIAHDDGAARLDWTTRQLANEKQTSRDLTDAHRTLNEDVGRLEQELSLERARCGELKDLHERSGAEAKHLQGQLERLQPSLSAANRRIAELQADTDAATVKLGTLELKLASEQEARRATDAARAQDKATYETEVAGLVLKVESLEGRHQVTTRLFDQSRSLLNEKIDELRLAERAARDLAADKIVIERRHASAQEEIKRLSDQAEEFGARNVDVQKRCSMLTNALAAKDAQIDQLQARADAIKRQFEDATGRYEQERTTIEGVNRKLIEELESERAERALAHGALAIARASREKLLTRIEDLKRGRFGRSTDGTLTESREPEGTNNITRLHAPDTQTDGS